MKMNSIHGGLLLPLWSIRPRYLRMVTKKLAVCPIHFMGDASDCFDIHVCLQNWGGRRPRVVKTRPPVPGANRIPQNTAYAHRVKSGRCDRPFRRGKSQTVGAPPNEPISPRIVSSNPGTKNTAPKIAKKNVHIANLLLPFGVNVEGEVGKSTDRLTLFGFR